ncbi:MarR family transcriptional regulator [Aliiroseovarius sp. S1123]|uniref:MarR family winged helix-turn-helix transcriptional regulator n=1 Tax=Aliiroseovarius sp. S1123 TaxID=2926404 RepID=UPI001FF563F3|nr:MarR family transcriptional regulator [Aliiroseovarius sp. S1123]MCK0171488.1 MarR family transcriptional regulator [Aliiroseovarius sp. S1123]
MNTPIGLDTDGLEPELRALIGVFSLYTYIDTNMRQQGDDCGGPNLERKVLVKLDRPKRIGTLARDLDALPSTMTTVADQMEARGLIERMRDPEDRRAWLLCLTEKGHQQRMETVGLAHTLLHETLGLSDDEVEAFAQISLKIHLKIQELNNG